MAPSPILGNRRLLNAVGAAICFGLLGFALYAQYGMGLDPCPLCILQRIGIFLMGVGFVLAALHHPRRWGGYVYAGFVVLAACATLGVAARQVYIQSQPPGSIPACGAPLNALLQMFPVTEVLRKVLRGGGECAEISWTFLGLGMAAWVLLWALALGTLAVVANGRRARARLT